MDSTTNLNESQILKALNQLVAEIPGQDIVKELEVDEINLKCGRIDDNGRIPTQLRDGFFSRKHTMKFLMDLLVDSFENQHT